MIVTVSDLLEQFRDYALKKIGNDESDITHRTTIGNIYEGLTKELLNKSVFEGLKLKLSRIALFIMIAKVLVMKLIAC
ncbi:MAG: hypothetical protein JWN78_582 [Bacteroidota bacterium]|nr:hypothetical protein [Bacteroidota bacterium]